MKKYVLILCVFTVSLGFSQENIPSVLSLSEYLGYVKSYHPIVKQANLILHKSEALLLKARGAFDPKIEIDFDEKRFQHKDYYTKLNAAFKIPTWYGIELKANFEPEIEDDHPSKSPEVDPCAISSGDCWELPKLRSFPKKESALGTPVRKSEVFKSVEIEEPKPTYPFKGEEIDNS